MCIYDFSIENFYFNHLNIRNQFASGNKYKLKIIQKNPWMYVLGFDPFKSVCAYECAKSFFSAHECQEQNLCWQMEHMDVYFFIFVESLNISIENEQNSIAPFSEWCTIISQKRMRANHTQKSSDMFMDLLRTYGRLYCLLTSFFGWLWVNIGFFYSFNVWLLFLAKTMCCVWHKYCLFIILNVYLFGRLLK